MKKTIHLCGLGNAIVDLIVNTTDQELGELGFEKSSQALADGADQSALLTRFRERGPILVSGGSVANSVFAAAQLGGKAALIGMVGDDRFGLHYKGECDTNKIAIANPILVGEPTGTCISLITPDAERTMRTFLGASAKVTPTHVKQSEQLIQDSEWLFIEGYLFGNPFNGIDAIMQAVKLAQQYETKIAVTFSESWVVQSFREPLDKVLRKTDLIFANEREATAFTGTDEPEKAIKALKKIVPNIVLTMGANGARGIFDKQEFQVPAYPCTPVDLTGAGDMFAGAFLYAITNGESPMRAARGACYMAREIITQRGARLASGIRERWDKFVEESK